MGRWFHRFATKTSQIAGHWGSFIAASLLILLWIITGPLLGFSEIWQLSINTATTIVTFLMVFLIQHAQSTDTRAMHKKLDELIVHLEGPRDEVAGIEQRDDP